MPPTKADPRDPSSRCSDVLLGAAWAWDEDDEHDAGAALGTCEREREPGPSAR